MHLPKFLTTVTSFSKILALSLIIILPLGTFFLGLYSGQMLEKSKMIEKEAIKQRTIDFAPIKIPTPSIPIEDGPMCTMDAMQCSDGTWVGRTGPNCEFACPK